MNDFRIYKTKASNIAYLNNEHIQLQCCEYTKPMINTDRLFHDLQIRLRYSFTDALTQNVKLRTHLGSKSFLIQLIMSKSQRQFSLPYEQSINATQFCQNSLSDLAFIQDLIVCKFRYNGTSWLLVYTLKPDLTTTSST